jgi:hypothetical protein
MDLARRLDEMKRTTKDVVVATSEVKMTDEGELNVPTVGPLLASDHAHTQIAEKTQIPQRFYDRLRTDFPALLANNVNTLFGQGADRRLIRVAEGRVRAVLSDRYRALDSYDLVMKVADRAIEHNAQVVDAQLTERRMFLRLTLPYAKEKVGELTQAVRAAYANDTHTRGAWGQAKELALDADYVVPGLIVSNSDVGAGSFRVEPYVLRLVCMNGAIGEYSLKQIHIGEKLELGEVIFSDQTRSLSDQALWSKVADTIDATFRPDSFRAMLDQMKGAQNIALPKVVPVVDVVARDLGLSEERKASLLSYFAAEGPTLYGLVQGVTRIAQDAPTADAQTDVERYAGGLLTHHGTVVAVGEA